MKTRSLSVIMFLLLLPAICASFAGYAQSDNGQAEGPAAPPPSAAPEQAGEAAAASEFPLVQSLGALGIVVSLIVLGFFAARRFAPQLFGRRSGERRMRLIESLSMGDRRSIALVHVDGCRYLVGNTAQSINLLAQLPRELSFPSEGPEDAVAPRDSADEPGDSFRRLYEVEKRPSSQGKPKTLPPDLRAKMRQLREALER